MRWSMVARPGGVGVSQIGDLDGGRAPSEDGEPVVCGMAGQVHEDVDILGAYGGGGRRVVHLGDVVPAVGKIPDPLGFPVGRLGVGKAVDLEPVPVVMAQERLDETGHRVTAKVRRQVADTDATVRPAGDRSRPPITIRAVPFRPVEMEFADGLRLEMRMIIGMEHEVRMGLVPGPRDLLRVESSRHEAFGIDQF